MQIDPLIRINTQFLRIANTRQHQSRRLVNRILSNVPFKVRVANRVIVFRRLRQKRRRPGFRKLRVSILLSRRRQPRTDTRHITQVICLRQTQPSPQSLLHRRIRLRWQAHAVQHLIHRNKVRLGTTLIDLSSRIRRPIQRISLFQCRFKRSHRLTTRDHHQTDITASNVFRQLIHQRLGLFATRRRINGLLRLQPSCINHRRRKVLRLTKGIKRRKQRICKRPHHRQGIQLVTKIRHPSIRLGTLDRFRNQTNRARRQAKIATIPMVHNLPHAHNNWQSVFSIHSQQNSLYSNGGGTKKPRRLKKRVCILGE